MSEMKKCPRCQLKLATPHKDQTECIRDLLSRHQIAQRELSTLRRKAQAWDTLAPILSPLSRIEQRVNFLTGQPIARHRATEE